MHWHWKNVPMHEKDNIHMLNQSSLFFHQLRGEAPWVQYYVNGRHGTNGRQYTKAYYLADGIYPELVVFVVN